MSVRQLLDALWAETITIVDRDQAWVTAVRGRGQPAQAWVRMPLAVSEGAVAALLRTATREGPA